MSEELVPDLDSDMDYGPDGLEGVVQKVETGVY